MNSSELGRGVSPPYYNHRSTIQPYLDQNLTHMKETVQSLALVFGLSIRIMGVATSTVLQIVASLQAESRHILRTGMLYSPHRNLTQTSYWIFSSGCHTNTETASNHSETKQDESFVPSCQTQSRCLLVYKRLATSHLARGCQRFFPFNTCDFVKVHRRSSVLRLTGVNDNKQRRKKVLGKSGVVGDANRRWRGWYEERSRDRALAGTYWTQIHSAQRLYIYQSSGVLKCFTP